MIIVKKRFLFHFANELAEWRRTAVEIRKLFYASNKKREAT